jgi:hypothetical protein
LNATVADDDTVNPLPVTVYVAPTGPWLGDTVIAGVVTVNDDDALSKLPSDPVAVTVVPDVPLGTANVQLNAPVAPVVNEPDVQLGIVTPSNTNDASTVETENPVPETVTVAPTGPWPGVTVIAGTVTVNVPLAV